MSPEPPSIFKRKRPLSPNPAPEYTINHSIEVIRPRIHTVTYHALKLLSQNHRKGKFRNARHIFSELIAEAMRVWVHWKEGVIELEPEPDFEALLTRLDTEGEIPGRTKITARPHANVVKTFRRGMIEYEGENPYNSYSDRLEEGILIVLGMNQGWLTGYVAKRSLFFKRETTFFTLEKQNQQK